MSLGDTEWGVPCYMACDAFKELSAAYDDIARGDTPLDVALATIKAQAQHAIEKHDDNAADRLPVCLPEHERTLLSLSVLGMLARTSIEQDGEPDFITVLLEELGEWADEVRAGNHDDAAAELAQCGAVIALGCAGYARRDDTDA